MFHLGESPMIVHLPSAVTFESREYFRSDELGLLLGRWGIVALWHCLEMEQLEDHFSISNA